MADRVLRLTDNRRINSVKLEALLRLADEDPAVNTTCPNWSATDMYLCRKRRNGANLLSSRNDPGYPQHTKRTSFEKRNT